WRGTGGGWRGGGGAGETDFVPGAGGGQFRLGVRAGNRVGLFGPGRGRLASRRPDLADYPRRISRPRLRSSRLRSVSALISAPSRSASEASHSHVSIRITAERLPHVLL